MNACAEMYVGTLFKSPNLEPAQMSVNGRMHKETHMFMRESSRAVITEEFYVNHHDWTSHTKCLVEKANTRVYTL